MRHRRSPVSLVLAVLVLSLGVAGPAAAAGAPPGGDTPPPVTPTSPAVPVDKVLVKLNALEDQLDAVTAKLDDANAKLDALTLKTKNVWDTVHYTKGYLQSGIPTLFDMVQKTCYVADSARLTAEYAAWGHPSAAPSWVVCP